VPAAELAEAKAVAGEQVARKVAAVDKLENRDVSERPVPTRSERPSRAGNADAKNGRSADKASAHKPSAVEKRASGKRQAAGDEAEDEPTAKAQPDAEGAAGKKRSTGRTGTDRKAADKTGDKKGGDKPGDKKAPADKALADKAAADQKKGARANPERIWVQVAGGASADDLPKAWAAAKAKAPQAFTGRSAYTTPLRATNRVLAGPFKTDAEARRFVNQLAKKGVSAFAFTSDAGQVVSKLSSE